MAKNGTTLVKKCDLKHLSISEIEIPTLDLKNISESKSIVIGKWIIDIIKNGLKKGSIKYNDVLPSKSEFAYCLGVSIGTMQNAYRYVEDLGYVESKQCIGTLVSNHKKNSKSLRKLTSKRDLAIDVIKRYIISEGYSCGMKLPSSEKISEITGFCINTVRLALENLTTNGILEHKYRVSNEHGWIVKNTDFKSSLKEEIKSETLVDMVVKDLEDYISANLRVGDRLPSHVELSKKLKASIKTIHDAISILSNKGIILAKRGKYGTTVIKLPDDNSIPLKAETSIFASALDTAFYHYERTQNYIKNMIVNEYQVGDRLPSIAELSKKLDRSHNTIRKAFQNLAKEGYLVFSRGRYGGTFVIDIPEVDTQVFKWLALNPLYTKDNENVSLERN